MESILSKILQAEGAPPPAEVPDLTARKDAAEQASEAGCIGWRDESGERAEVIELRTKSGAVAALLYSWIDFAEFDPSAGITIHARGSKVAIRGRNLNREAESRTGLFRGIIHRQVSFVRESQRCEELTASESSVFIESIAW